MDDSFYVNNATQSSTLIGGAGNDNLQGGSGNDTLDGGDGNDGLSGGNGNDTLSGGAGDDTLDGSRGINTLDGGAGRDTAYFDFSDKTLSTDSLQFIAGVTAGQTYSATLNGAAGGSFKDVEAISISGTYGNDRIGGVNVGWGSSFSGVTGTDTLVLDLSANTGGFYFNVFNGYGNDQTNGANRINISAFDGYEFTGGSGDDFFYVINATEASTLVGGAGNDTLYGGSGNDKLTGGDGNDYLDGGTGRDTYFLSASIGGWFDTINGFVGGATGDLIDFTPLLVQLVGYAANSDPRTSGHLQLRTSGAHVILAVDRDGTAGVAAAAVDVLVFNNITLASLTAANFIATGPGGNFGVATSGTAGDDTLTGTEQDDSLSGLAGNDTLSGLGGNDLLSGGAGNDAIDGGAGIDTASFADATAAVNVSLATAAAQITGGAGTDTLTNVENLLGSAFNDTLAGNAGDNLLDGGAGTDAVTYAAATSGVTVNLNTAQAQATGGAGTDMLVSIENLTGSAFADVITGNSGNNVLDGGAGVDTLTYALASAAATVDLTVTTAQSTNLGTDTILNFENLIGSQASDSLRGDGSDNRIDGGDGNDTIDARGGANIVNGETGNDAITSTGGSDAVDGGAGLDNWTGAYGTTSSARTFTWNGATASGTLSTGGSTTTALTSIEQISLTTGGGADSFAITAQTGSGTLDGGAGVDTLTVDETTFAGSQSTHTITSAAGTFGGRFYGSSTAGGSIAFSNFEQVTWKGTAGNDSVIANGAALATAGRSLDLDAGGGTGDFLQLDVSALTGPATFVAALDGTVSSNVGTYRNFERFALTFGNGGATVGTLGANDSVVVGSGTNTVTTGDGADVVTSNGGTDTIDGGTGADVWTGVYTNGTGAREFSWNGATGVGSLTTGGVATATLAAIEQIALSTGGGNDNIEITSQKGNSTLDAGAGSDTLVIDNSAFASASSSHSITSSGGVFGATVFGDAATFSAISASNFETIIWTGSAGNDTIGVNAASLATVGRALTLNAGAGTGDWLVLDASALTGTRSFVAATDGSVNSNIGTYSNFERFSLTLGAGANTVVTLAGNDSITSNGGTDNIDGGAGFDNWTGTYTAGTGARAIHVERQHRFGDACHRRRNHCYACRDRTDRFADHRHGQ